jgi:hypothetical protein
LCCQARTQIFLIKVNYWVSAVFCFAQELQSYYYYFNY